MQTSLRRRHRDRVVRRGIGMTIESDFYATEAGRQHFTDQLTSIRYVSATFQPRKNGPMLTCSFANCSACKKLVILIACSATSRAATTISATT
tara:strand:- start:1047 stop:1325 length:279 start_codon:yes stop_codon:yes gene_type:complete